MYVSKILTILGTWNTHEVSFSSSWIFNLDANPCKIQSKVILINLMTLRKMTHLDSLEQSAHVESSMMQIRSFSGFSSMKGRLVKVVVEEKLGKSLDLKCVKKVPMCIGWPVRDFSAPAIPPVKILCSIPYIWSLLSSSSGGSRSSSSTYTSFVRSLVRGYEVCESIDGLVDELKEEDEGSSYVFESEQLQLESVLRKCVCQRVGWKLFIVHVLAKVDPPGEELLFVCLIQCDESRSWSETKVLFICKMT